MKLEKFVREPQAEIVGHWPAGVHGGGGHLAPKIVVVAGIIDEDVREVQVSRLAIPGMKVEMEAIAVVGT